MRILGKRWQDGYLDEASLPAHCRIDVRIWAVAGRVRGLYFERPPDLRLVWNYLRDIGARQVIRKVRSRRAERLRNAKYVALGCGVVLSDDLASHSPTRSGLVGTPVAFIAPCHPAAAERVLLPHGLIRPLPEDVGFTDGELWHLREPVPAPDEALRHVAGWSSHSGWPLSPRPVSQLLDRAQALPDRDDRRRSHRRLPSGSEVKDRDSASRSGRSGRRAALYGYGNYAKNVILPNLCQDLDLVRINEIDPAQLGHKSFRDVARDTSPHWRPDDRIDVALIAGYHHTHAPLAVAALDAGAAAIVEKPVVTADAQLTDLLAAMEASDQPLFTCFQRRYAPFNDLVYEDLACVPGDPVSYHCIVYEVPLPEKHWYRWPNSGTSITSNGCHWIDHFLHLNQYRPVWRSHVVGAERSDQVAVVVELENGAFFSMTLTRQGSPRIGLQNHIELRAGERSVRILNDRSYVAEGPTSQLRSTTFDRMAAHRRMYESILTEFLRGGPGDSVEQTRRSAAAVLELDTQLQQHAGGVRTESPRM